MSNISLTHIFILSSTMLVLMISSIYLTLLTKRLEKECWLFYSSIILLVVMMVLSQSFADYDYYRLVHKERFFSSFITFMSLEDIYVILVVLLLAQVYIANMYRLKKKVYMPDQVIYEGFNHFPEGICFADKSGMPMLVNHQMQNIIYNLFCVPMVNMNELKQRFKQGQIVEGCSVMDMGEYYIVHVFEEVYSIRYLTLNNITEVTATKITQEYHLLQELEITNQKLIETNQRLKDFNQKVEQYVREKEILEAKIKVHDDIGRSLLAFRSYLNKTTKDRNELLKLWNQSIHLMKDERQEQENLDNYQHVIKMAKRLGVHLEVNGKQPSHKNARRILSLLLLESLTNTVRHAHGDCIYADIVEQAGSYCIKVSNNGIQPTKPIQEKGGLLNLRKMIELHHGSMEIKQKPNFTIHVHLMKE